MIAVNAPSDTAVVRYLDAVPTGLPARLDARDELHCLSPSWKDVVLRRLAIAAEGNVDTVAWMAALFGILADPTIL